MVSCLIADYIITQLFSYIFRYMVYKGSIQIKKCPKKWKKSTIFLAPPPLPQDALDFFEFGKNLKLGKFGIFGTPLKTRNIKLKTLKID